MDLSNIFWLCCDSVVENGPTLSIREQVELFSSHGVIVAPHGAGLVNLLFTPPFSAVIEVFPYHTHHKLYATMAAMAGIAHYPVHTFNGSSVLSSSKVCAGVALKLFYMPLMSY